MIAVEEIKECGSCHRKVSTDDLELFRLHPLKGWCWGCLHEYRELGESIEIRKDELARLTEHVNRAKLALEELKRRMEAGGPIAITEHLLVVPDDHASRLRIKVLDYRKGYWAEAPLDPQHIAALASVLTGKVETKEVES